jgi:hypothetical protein
MLTFDEDTHTYWWETESAKVRVPSVTEIMKATGISKGKPPYVSWADWYKAQRRGSSVHQITEILDRGLEPDMSMVDEDIYDDVCNMVDAWERFKIDYDVEIIEVEQSAVYLDHKQGVGAYPLFAGTVDRVYDRVCEIWGKTRFLMDIKTSSSLREEVLIQTGLYDLMLNIGRTDAVHLKKDGKYSLWETTDLERQRRLAGDTIYRYHNWEVHKNKRGMKRV